MNLNYEINIFLFLNVFYKVFTLIMPYRCLKSKVAISVGGSSASATANLVIATISAW